MERRNSPNTKNMSFIQAKDSFLNDREASMGIKDDPPKDDIIDYEEPAFLKDIREVKKNPQDDEFERDDEPDMFKKLEKRQSEENKINPFDVAKIFNPALDDMDNLEHLCYDENEARTSHEAPNKEEQFAFKRR
jgi:hypothetical protein